MASAETDHARRARMRNCRCDSASMQSPGAMTIIRRFPGPAPRGQNLPRLQNHQRRGQKQILHQPPKNLPLAVAHGQRPARAHRRRGVAPQLNRGKANLQARRVAPPQGVARNRRPGAPHRQRRKHRANRRRKRYNRPNPRQRRRAGQAKSRRQKRRPPRRKRKARRGRVGIKNGINTRHDCKG